MSDLEVRQTALDPQRSFIVQAPAGSGKTSLLTQRFLVLLSGVSVPEEILALTFTRKAAGEMRERIVHALDFARNHPRPSEPFLEKTWLLARNALQRNDELLWNLEDNPARLRVLTIDSLCARLARGLPILSQFGASPRAIDDASEYYLEAAKRTLEALHDSEPEHSEAIARLLLHLDNNMLRVQEQVAEMLARRDKWMRPLVSLFGDLQEVGASALREALEQTLSNIIREHLETLREMFSSEQLFRLGPLAKFGARRLEERGKANPLSPWLAYEGLPGVEPEHLPLWESLRRMLLTEKGEWRKNPTAKLGFPPAKEGRDKNQRADFKAAKNQLKAILAELFDRDELARHLHEVGSLPPPSYSDSQWEILRALLQVSRLAVGQLTLVFKELSLSDFVQISQRAHRALGTDEEPTDLAMALDAKLQHILVDEFQDTSLGQLQLLERLTAEWYPGDGRTAFLVGDPMQSIYRFRDAEVGLFLKVKNSGLGQLRPQSLLLQSNFRSQGGLVDWFNETFSEVFPKTEDPAVGSVPYASAEAARPSEKGAVSCWAIPDNGDPDRQKLSEAEAVVEIVQQTWLEDPEASIAILVRSRAHLEETLPLLKSRGFRYQGVDLEPLAKKSSVRDLLALTKALCKPADRLSWLTVLRAPWCGLDTADLLALADHAQEATIASVLAQFQDIPKLSPQGKDRISKVWPALAKALKNRQRYSLRRWIESTWLALGGPASLLRESSLSDCQTFFNLLEQSGREHKGDPLELVSRRIDKLFAQADVTADGRLQIMTIHKSKGLEFDTVILPGLSNPPRNQEEPLVSWLEWSSPKRGQSELLLAPITEKGGPKDPVYSFVSNLENKKEKNESTRLLYVAATRAKRQLHLLARVLDDDKQDHGTLRVPSKGTFLHLLWASLEDDFTLAAEARRPGPKPLEPAPPAVGQLLVHRLHDSWLPPSLPADLSLRKTEIVDEEDLSDDPKFEWAGETVKHVGTVVHRVLQQMGREGLENWNKDRLEALRAYLAGRLGHFGVPPEQIPAAVQRATLALHESLSSQRGRWILDSNHQESKSEYAVSGVWGGRLVKSVVDRTFVDQHGTRWVIDYKTGSHQGADLDGFLEKEVERYKPQLKRYARLLQRLDGRPVKMGIYFPLLKAWREWPLEEFQQAKQLEFQF